jgi:hypothetical protein
MDTVIPIYESVSVSTPKSVWLRRILDPLVRSCRLPKIPLEIRPLDGLGLCSSFEPDDRVFLSNRIVFWHKIKIANVYLHESAHRLLDHAPMHVQPHGVEFFTLLLTLQIRAEPHIKLLGSYKPTIARLAFYDCKDESPVWRQHNIALDDWPTVQVAWAIKTANELAKSDLDAVGIARMLPDLWVKQVEKYRANIDHDILAERERVKELERLHELADRYKSGLIAVSFFLFVFMCAALTEAAK